METLNGLKRTHYCGDLRERNINEEVFIVGGYDHGNESWN